MSDRKGLPSAPLPPAPPPPPRIVIVEVPTGTRLQYSLEHRHNSISEELMNASLGQAQALSDRARFEHAVPAEQQTKQVQSIGVVVVIVALSAFVAVGLKPEAGQWILGIAGIVTGVFGGMYLANKLTAPKSPPPSDT